MGIVLQIIGAATVILILAIILGLALLRWKLKRLSRDLGGVADAFSQGPPVRARLRVALPSHWDAPEVKWEVSDFEKLGFERIAAYESPDIPGLIFLPFVSPDGGAYAVVYHGPQTMGVWCDIYTKYEDGASLTVTSAPRGGELDQREGREKVHLPGEPVAKLATAHRDKLAKRPIRPATIEGFAQDFERAYAEEMEWRILRGYSEAEMRAVAAMDGANYSDQTFALSREAMNTRATEQLNDVLRRKYMEAGGLSAVDWEDQRDRILIVHDQLTSEEVLDEISEYIDLSEEAYNQAESTDLTPREFMDWLNDLLPPKDRYQKLRTLYKPVEADVWLAPKIS